MTTPSGRKPRPYVLGAARRGRTAGAPGPRPRGSRSGDEPRPYEDASHIAGA